MIRTIFLVASVLVVVASSARADDPCKTGTTAKRLDCLSKLVGTLTSDVQVQSITGQQKCLTDHENVSVNMDACTAAPTHWKLLPKQK
jgi:hypothetical protein